MQKKSKQNKNKKDLFGKANYNEQLMSLVKIAVGVIIVLGIVYLGTALATGEIKLSDKKKEEETEPVIQYDEIIAGQVMNRSSDEYYVLLYNFTDTEATYLLSLRDSYQANTESLPFYIVDLEKGFNQILIPDEDEKYKEKPSNISDLKVKEPTLLKIKKGKVTERVETNDKIKEYLEKIA